MSDTVFVLYKAFSQFLMPLGSSLAGLVLALITRKFGHRKIALTLTVFSIFWLWLWSTPVWSDFIRGRLEAGWPYQKPSAYPKADAIVVLGGGVRSNSGKTLPPYDLNRASDRELFAAQLFRTGKAPLIILSGGADPVRQGAITASGMKIFLINLGIPAAKIVADASSRNTVENMEEVVLLLKKLNGKSILLVTSALHMQRAYWLFSRTGLTVIPAPTDFEVIPSSFNLSRLVPDAESLENSTRAARELTGLLYYRIRFR
jgi:uncharacterized SAM-binding protein YcdF (DUF218 family)